MGTPSMNSEFGGALYSRGINCTSDDFPEPVAPTIATVLPFGILREMFFRTGVAVVGEIQVPKFDFPLNLKSLRTAGSVANLGLGIQDVVQPLHRGAAALQQVHDPAQRDHRPGQRAQVEDELNELSPGDRSLEPPPGRQTRG